MDSGAAGALTRKDIINQATWRTGAEGRACWRAGVYWCVTPGCTGNSFRGKPRSRLSDLQPAVVRAQGGLERCFRLTKTHAHMLRHALALTHPEGSQRGEGSITRLPSFAHEPLLLTYRFTSSLCLLLNLFCRTPPSKPPPLPPTPRPPRSLRSAASVVFPNL